MALATFEMPSPLPVNSKVFDLLFNQSVSPAGGQFFQTIERTEPLWFAKFETPPLSDTRDQQFQAFLDDLEGSMGVLLAFDPRRPRPYAYRNMAGEPWRASSGTAPTVVSASRTASTLTLNGLLNGAILTRGDYVSFKIVNAWYLFRVRQTVVAASNAATLVVTPRPPTFSTQTYAARMTRACATMKLMGRVSKTDSVDSLPKYSFSASQIRDRSTS